MFRPITLFIALRYTQARRRTGFLSLISLISLVGIALGVAALITVLSVMNGFESELRARILGMTSHLIISSPFGAGLADWRRVAQIVDREEEVLGSAPFVEGQAMISSGGRVAGVLLRGILPEEEPKVSQIELLSGKLEAIQPGRFGIILGSALARTLGVGLGDRVMVVTPQVSTTPVGLVPRIRRFTVVGIFHVGMYEYDRSLALIHLRDAQRLFRLGERISGLRLKLDDLFAAPEMAQKLQARLGLSYSISDWTRLHANFFRAIRMEKRVMFLILSLIVAVAAFNIVSTLVMVVTDKRGEIAILRTFGMTPFEVLLVFLLLGMLLSLSGIAIGVVSGVALALNVETIVPFLERLLGIHFLSPDVYHLSELPSELHLQDVVVIALSAFLLSLAATLYPAWQASKVAPARELRYE